MGTLVLTVVGGATPTVVPAQSSEASVTAAAVTASSTATTSTTTCEVSSPALRGVKRPALASSKSTISKSTLFEHQLKTDQNGALAPDAKYIFFHCTLHCWSLMFSMMHRSPFKNKSNACKRLIRYHVFHKLEPSSDELEGEENELETRAGQLLSKFHQMINKYHYLLLMVSCWSVEC